MKIYICADVAQKAVLAGTALPLCHNTLADAEQADLILVTNKLVTITGTATFPTPAPHSPWAMGDRHRLRRFIDPAKPPPEP